MENIFKQVIEAEQSNEDKKVYSFEIDHTPEREYRGIFLSAWEESLHFLRGRKMVGETITRSDDFKDKVLEDVEAVKTDTRKQTAKLKDLTKYFQENPTPVEGQKSNNADSLENDRLKNLKLLFSGEELVQLLGARLTGKNKLPSREDTIATYFRYYLPIIEHLQPRAFSQSTLEKIEQIRRNEPLMNSTQTAHPNFDPRECLWRAAIYLASREESLQEAVQSYLNDFETSLAYLQKLPTI